MVSKEHSFYFSLFVDECGAKKRTAVISLCELRHGWWIIPILWDGCLPCICCNCHSGVLLSVMRGSNDQRWLLRRRGLLSSSSSSTFFDTVVVLFDMGLGVIAVWSHDHSGPKRVELGEVGMLWEVLRIVRVPDSGSSTLLCMRSWDLQKNCFIWVFGWIELYSTNAIDFL